MEIKIYKGHSHPNVTDCCVVIDVIRAFTTAAFAFGAGAREIHFVGTKEEAFLMRERDPSLLLTGEEEGEAIPGFDYPNSPFEIHQAPIRNKILVQRTSSGTQGIVGCPNAAHMLAASFVNAAATVAWILQGEHRSVSLIVTGRVNGDEDLALAEYMALCLKGKKPLPQPFLERVKQSPAGLRTLQTSTGKEDLEMATEIDRFPFAIEVVERVGTPSER